MCQNVLRAWQYRRRQSQEISRIKNIQGFVGHVMEFGLYLAGSEVGAGKCLNMDKLSLMAI